MATSERSIDVAGVSHPVEEPVFFPAQSETLFGILTNPTAPANGSAVMILSGGATPVTTNRNRLSVRLCRGVAALGFHGFRLDYHGAGESTGKVEELKLNRPFREDADGALAWMQRRGIDDFVLVGSCFGSRVALAEAAAREQVRRLILVASPTRDAVMGKRAIAKTADEWSIWRFVRRALHPDVLRGWLDARRRVLYRHYAHEKWRAIVRLIHHRFSHSRDDQVPWVSSQFLQQFRTVIERDVQVLFVFGESDGFYSDFRLALTGELGTIIENAGAKVEIRMLPGHVHGFTRLSVQDAVLREIFEWLAPGSAEDSPAIRSELMETAPDMRTS